MLAKRPNTFAPVTVESKHAQCDCARTIRRLRQERDEARERAISLERRIEDGERKPFTFIEDLGGKPLHARLFARLAAAKGMVRHEALYDALYGDRPECDHPSPDGALKVYVCQVRKLFRENGLPNPIRTYWAQGYSLTPEARAAIAEALGRTEPLSLEDFAPIDFTGINAEALG